MKIIVLIYESVKDLEINPFMQSKLVFAKNAISMCFFFFLLIIDLCLLMLAIMAQIFNPILELIIPLEIFTKEAKAQMKIHTVTVITKESGQCNSELYKAFYSYYSAI